MCGRFGSWEFREASEDYYREMDAMKQDLIQWYRSGNYDKPCLVVWVATRRAIALDDGMDSFEVLRQGRVPARMRVQARDPTEHSRQERFRTLRRRGCTTPRGGPCLNPQRTQGRNAPVPQNRLAALRQSEIPNHHADNRPPRTSPIQG